jgi:sugar O-acyltransferase (sialic acid O-acetyltransferase NeuD family)
MKVVIFGDKILANVAWYVLTHDSEHDVVGFTVDSAYLAENTLHGLPIVAFEEVEKHFPPESIAMIVPLGARNLNSLREEKHRVGRAKGYRFITYVSSKAVTWPDLSIGENCMVAEATTVQPFAKVGSGVMMRAGVNVGHHVQIGDNCFIAGHACIGGAANIGQRCFLGMNSTIRDGLTIAPRCIIAAGAVVTADTQENGIYVGVPAKRSPNAADNSTRY